MAGFGWNSRHSNTHGSKRPYVPAQIACRICDHVFTSTQALIDHIESHMLEDDIAARRQHGLNLMPSMTTTDAFANPFQRSSFSSPTIPVTHTLSLGQSTGYNFPSLQERNSTTLSLSQNGYNFPSLQDRNMNLYGATPHTLTPESQLSLLGRSYFDPIGSQQYEAFALQMRHRAMEELVTDGTKPFLRQLEKPIPYKPGLRASTRSDVDMLDLTLKL